MEQHVVKILSVADVTHNVRTYRVEKPSGYEFTPGQATELSIQKDGWQEEKRPFTFTSLNDWPYLEFTIKSYHDHNGVTHQLYQLKEGDELILRDVWGAIAYKGPGYFLAGGAGITPFLAILRQLHKEGTAAGNTLLFSNKTSKDVIHQEELTHILGGNAKYILTKEQKEGFLNGPLNKALLQQEVTDFSKPFYVCGPDKMVEELTGILKELGASPDSVIFEK